VHLWGIAVGLVISGEYFGWTLPHNSTAAAASKPFHQNICPMKLSTHTVSHGLKETRRRYVFDEPCLVGFVRLDTNAGPVAAGFAHHRLESVIRHAKEQSADQDPVHEVLVEQRLDICCGIRRLLWERPQLLDHTGSGLILPVNSDGSKTIKDVFERLVDDVRY
jgi:hypothetical protein